MQKKKLFYSGKRELFNLGFTCCYMKFNNLMRKCLVTAAVVSCRTWEYSFLSPKLMDFTEPFYSTDMKMSQIKSSGTFEKRRKPKNSLTSLSVIFLFLKCVILLSLMSQSEPHKCHTSVVQKWYNPTLHRPSTAQLDCSNSFIRINVTLNKSPVFLLWGFWQCLTSLPLTFSILWLTQRINTSKMTVYQLRGDMAHFPIFDPYTLMALGLSENVSSVLKLALSSA